MWTDSFAFDYHTSGSGITLSYCSRLKILNQRNFQVTSFQIQQQQIRHVNIFISNYFFSVLLVLISSLSLLIRVLVWRRFFHYVSYLQSWLTFHILTQNHIKDIHCCFLVLISFYAYSWSHFVHFYKSLPFYFHYAHRHLQSSEYFYSEGRKKKKNNKKSFIRVESTLHLQPLSWVHYRQCHVGTAFHFFFYCSRILSLCCAFLGGYFAAVENVKSTWLIVPSFIHFFFKPQLHSAWGPRRLIRLLIIKRNELLYYKKRPQFNVPIST